MGEALWSAFASLSCGCHLAAIALPLGRAKDKVRVVQMVEAKVLDMPRFEKMLERHGLTVKWKDFSRTLLGGP